MSSIALSSSLLIQLIALYSLLLNSSSIFFSLAIVLFSSVTAL